MNHIMMVYHEQDYYSVSLNEELANRSQIDGDDLRHCESCNREW